MKMPRGIVLRISVFNRKFLSSNSTAGIASGWVHPSVEAESAEFSQHKNFILSHVLIGCVGVIGVPAVLAFGGTFGLVEAVCVLAFSFPLFWAYFTSVTGRLDWGTMGSLTTLSILIVGLCVFSGGLNSPLLALLCIVPLEASTRLGSKSEKFSIYIVTLSIAAVLFAPLNWKFLPINDGAHLQIVATATILVYAFLLAIRHNLYRRNTVEKVSSQMDHLKLICDNVTDTVSCHNASGQTNFVSSAAFGLFGEKSAKLIESGFFDQLHVQDRVDFLKQISAAPKDGSAQKGRFRMKCLSEGKADWKWVEISSRALGHQVADEFDVVCVSRDISEVVEQEQQFQKTSVEAEETGEAQRRFLATMSHEWRTPLNAILGFSDILQQELFGKLPYERHLEYVLLIHESGQHLLNLVNDLLNMSRIESDKYELSPEPFQVDEIVEATLKMLHQMAASNGVMISRNISDELPDLTADRRSCQQILINLVSNAIKFSHEGGKVIVSAKQRGNNLLMSVTDNGIGMDKEFLSKIGTPFTQADSGKDRKFEGSGLGLSVVKGLIDLHNGEFSVESVKGEGTTVTVSLPLNVDKVQLVPADEKKSLVHLNESAAASMSISSTTTTSRKGDTRARVSA